MNGITNKQIKLLKTLSKSRWPVVARWDHADLSELSHRRLVDRTNAMSAEGRTSSQAIWVISDYGRAYLKEERAGC